MFTIIKLTLLLVLMMFPALGATSVVSLNQAAAAGAPKGKPAEQRGYKYASEGHLYAVDETNQSSEKRLLAAGGINEVEVKRLKLLLLLMMSLGPYGAPAQ